MSRDQGISLSSEFDIMVLKQHRGIWGGVRVFVLSSMFYLHSECIEEV